MVTDKHGVEIPQKLVSFEREVVAKLLRYALAILDGVYSVDEYNDVDSRWGAIEHLVRAQEAAESLIDLIRETWHEGMEPEITVVKHVTPARDGEEEHVWTDSKCQHFTEYYADGRAVPEEAYQEEEQGHIEEWHRRV